MALLRSNKALYRRGEELRAGRHSGRGFLPAGQKVPGGLFVPGRAGKVGKGCLFDLLCSGDV